MGDTNQIDRTVVDSYTPATATALRREGAEVERARIVKLIQDWAQQCTDDPTALKPSVVLTLLAKPIISTDW